MTPALKRDDQQRDSARACRLQGGAEFDQMLMNDVQYSNTTKPSHAINYNVLESTLGRRAKLLG